MRGKLRHLWGHKREIASHWLIMTLVLLILASILAGASWYPATWLGSHHRDPYLDIWVDDTEGLSYNELMDAAERLDEVWDQIQAEAPDWVPELTRESSHNWIMELVPMFNYEGASNLVTYPKILPVLSLSGMEHNHLGGRSNCGDAFIFNYRYINPLSTWYGRGAWLSVMAHELAHNHQGILCEQRDRELIEHSAQLSSWEVMAALANQGNHYALFALVGELRGVFINAANARALTAGGRIFRDFERRAKAMTDDPIKWGNYLKSRRFWADTFERLDWILRTYSERPVQRLAQGLLDGEIRGLALRNGSGILKVDDLRYTLAHLEDLVDTHLADLSGQL